MTESSFMDHVQHATELKDVIAGLEPAYAPGVPEPEELDLRLTAFNSAIGAAEGAHLDAEATASTYGDMARERDDCLKLVLSAGTSVLAFMRSKRKTLGRQFKGVERIVKKMRGTRPKKAPPPPPEGEPPEKARNRGQQSYREQAGHLQTLHALVNGNAAYNPPANHPAHPDKLDELLTALNTCNGQISVLKAAVIRSETLREEKFTEKDVGLHDYFHAMKESVKGQYGADSTQYADVAGILY